MTDINSQRLQAMQLYVHNRLAGNIDQLLPLFCEDGEIIDLESKSHKGNSQLREYFSQPVKVQPSVGLPTHDSDTYYIDLSFVWGVKNIRTNFEFEDQGTKIKKITLKSTGLI